MGYSLRTYLRWPIRVVQPGTGAKSLADNPLIGSRRLSAFGLHRMCGAIRATLRKGSYPIPPAILRRPARP